MGQTLLYFVRAAGDSRAAKAATERSCEHFCHRGADALISASAIVGASSATTRTRASPRSTRHLAASAGLRSTSSRPRASRRSSMRGVDQRADEQSCACAPRMIGQVTRDADGDGLRRELGRDRRERGRLAVDDDRIRRATDLGAVRGRRSPPVASDHEGAAPMRLSLEPCLKDPDPETRFAAAAAIGESRSRGREVGAARPAAPSAQTSPSSRAGSDRIGGSRSAFRWSR